jgi:beta-ureidopropionase
VINVAVVQTGEMSPDRGEALAYLTGLFREAATPGTDVVLFSELATTPYFGLTGNDEYKTWAESVPGASTAAFAAVAKELGVGVIFGMYERAADGTLYNSAVVIDGSGEIVPGRTMFGESQPTYRKTSIPMGNGTGFPVNEKQFFDPGAGPVVFDAFGITFSCLICYDRSFPEYWEAARTMGAEAIFVLVSSFGTRQDLFQLELQVRAKDSQCWTVAANRGGVEVMDGIEVSAFGLSCYVSPHGVLQGSAPAHEQPYILRAELDLDHMRELRGIHRFQRDKVPAVFEQIAVMKRAAGSEHSRLAAEGAAATT